MTTDPGGRQIPPMHRDITRLPEALDVQIRHRHFDPPRRVTTRGVDRQVTDAVEFEVKVSEPFPIRALGPALWVGNHPITAAETADPQTYRFFAFEPEKLLAQAPISLGWSAPGEPRKQTRFRFALPAR
jgi:hypothetical protein